MFYFVESVEYRGRLFWQVFNSDHDGRFAVSARYESRVEADADCAGRNGERVVFGRRRRAA